MNNSDNSEQIIEIDSIQYNNYIEKEPEFKKGTLSKFKLYYKILQEDYKDITKNSLIAYQLNKNLYNVGFLLKYIYPNIFIFKDPRLYYIWSIIVNDDTDIFIKDINLYRRENIIKDNLYEHYKNNS